MPHNTGDAILGSFVLVGMLYWAWFAFMGVLVPIAIVSTMRNVKRIRVQLERLNDNLESRGRTSGSGMLGL